MNKLLFAVLTCSLVLFLAAGAGQVAVADTLSPLTGAAAQPVESHGTRAPAPPGRAFAGPNLVSGGLYGTDGDNLYLVDKATGAETLIGPHGAAASFIGALAFDNNGTLYGTSGGAGTSLYTIDVTTGLATIVGPLNIGFVFEGGLAFDASGTLFGVNQGDDHNAKAFTVDTTTGAAMVIGPDPGEARDLNDLTFDGQTFYALDRVSDTFGVLNAANGAYTPIGNTGATVGDSGGLAVDPAGGRMYATFAGTGRFYVVDPATGAATDIGPTTAVFGLAFAPPRRVYLPLVIR